MNDDIRAAILAHDAAGTLLDALFNEYGKNWYDDTDPFLISLADLHNEGEIELLAIVTPQSIEPYKETSFFEGQNLYRTLIPHIEAPAAELLTVVQTLIDGAGHDAAANLPVEEFARWCSLKTDRPAELLSLVDNKFPNADRFLTLALRYGALVDRTYFMDRAYGFLTSDSEVEQKAALRALWQIDLTTPADWSQWTTELKDLFERQDSDDVSGTMLDTIAEQLKKSAPGNIDEILELAFRIIDRSGDHVLDMGARAAASDPAKLPPTLLNAIIEALKNVKGSNLGTSRVIDILLRKMLTTHMLAARQLLESLLCRDDDAIDPERFSSTWSRLRSAEPDDLAGWVAAWLLAGDYALCDALSNALFADRAEEASLDIDFSKYGLAARDYPYVARKTIGTFFLKPAIMAAILASLLRSAPNSVVEDIVELLVDPVLRNYSGVGDKHLASVIADDTDPATPHVRTAVERHEAYLDGLKSIGTVPELRPSERERTMEWHRHTDQMNESFRAARKKSIFADVVSESTLLYGTRSVSYLQQGPETPRRFEVPLSSFGYSMEVPRIDIVDPVGLQQMLMAFKRESRPE